MTEPPRHPSLMSSIIFSSPVSILMIVALNTPLGLLFISVLLNLWLWPYLDLSFGVNSSILVFCLSLCLLLCVRKASLSPAPGSNGLMIKRSCGTQGLELQEVSWCVVRVLCCCDLAALSVRPVVCRGSPCLLWPMFGPWPACGKF